jgi:hypothetical protein
MALLTCALAALLILAGLAGLAMSVDLIPTELGLYYGVSGIILVGCGAIVLAVAALIARLDRIVAPKPAPAAAPEAAPFEVSRYVSGGTEYAIYSDGSLVAETEEGPLRFASMADFRAYVEARTTETVER